MPTQVTQRGTGWQPDPTGRHEGRYFVSGHPTDLIRDGNVESVDPEGEYQLEHRVEDYPVSAHRVEDYPVSAPASSRSARLWLVAGIVVLLLAAAGATVAVLAQALSTMETYATPC